MRTNDQPLDSVNNKALDRLVDGDLPDIERRELLLRLENDPEGWRRCALAFLEDQAWRKALATAANTESTPSPCVAAPRPPLSGQAWIRRASIAASLMVSTFAAGFAAGGLTKAGHEVEVATSQPPTTVPIPAPAASDPDQIREVGSLELVDSSAGESRPERFPIRSGPGLDEKWLRSLPPSVPSYIRAQLERQGYQVDERRKLVSVELGDGRRVSIPVDEVEVDYVGQQPL
jgi:hypothetical protein